MKRAELLRFALDHAPDLAIQPAVWLKGRQLARRRFDDRFWRELERFKAVSAMPLHEVREIQIVAIRQLLQLAFDHSPYYRRMMADSGHEYGDIASLDDLSLLPVLRRNDVAEYSGQMLVREPKPEDVKHHTSGSTGKRLDFWLPDALRYSWNAAHLYGLYSWFGFEPGMPRVTIGGRYLGSRPSGRVVRNPHENQLVLGSHGLRGESTPRYVAAIKRFAPTAIQGHPSVIASLVTQANTIGLELPHVGTVFTTGEELSQEMRSLIQEGFSASAVVNMYGNGENTIATSECPVGQGLHVDELFGYVELIPHESGLFEIVTTSLLNDLMPFVRYGTGDLTTGWLEGECECGCSWRRLANVVGRIDDTFTLPDGRRVLPVEIRTMMAASVSDTPAYKVKVERTAKNIELILYDEGESSASTVRAMVGVLHQIAPGAVVSVRSAPRLEELSVGGKRRIVEVVSALSSDKP